MIFDSLIAIWFLTGAPALIRHGVPALKPLEKVAQR
jgi:hypothetical protein